MTFSVKAKKAVAGALALSTLMWSMAMFAVPVALAATHNSGCLVNVNGTVYLIDGGQKRGFTSAEVFLSHGYNFGQVVAATSDDANLPTGSILIYADGTLVKGPSDPLVYLVVGGQKRGFTSGSVFTGLGYSFANIQWAPQNTFSDIPTGANIDSTSIAGLPMSGPGPKTVSCTMGADGSGDLEGGAGDITVTLNSTYSAENVGEDESDVPVLSFDVEADEGSDVRITSVKVELQQTVGTNPEDITDYLSEASIWMGSTQVGSADTDTFAESSDRYSKSISLSNAIVRAGETEEFVVKVSAVDGIDSSDIDDDAWDVEIDSLRFIDAEGVTTTETPAADAIDQAFDVDTYASANDVELTAALNNSDDDINEAHVLDIDDTNDTDEVEVLSFTLEASGDSDINVTEIPILFTTAEASDGGYDDPDDVLIRAQLWMGGDVLDTQSFLSSDANGDTEVITFEDFDFDVEAGEEVELMVTVDIQDTATALDNGDTVKAELDATRVDLIEATDETGEDVATGDLEGTALGEAHAMYDEGIMVEFVSSSATVDYGDPNATNDHDLATFTIVFDVTAFDGDAYVDNTDPALTGGGTAHDLALASGSGTVVDADVTSNATEGTDSFTVEQGETERFTLTVIITPSADGLFQLELGSVLYAPEASGDVDGTIDYTFNLDEFETDSVYLNNDAA